jgi:cyclic-di-AMP phosphodiesterase PgpH
VKSDGMTRADLDIKRLSADDVQQNQSAASRLAPYATVWAMVLIFLLINGLIVAAPSGAARTQVDLSVGESAAVDVLAPVPISYQSVVRTERARAEAAGAVPDIYDAPDARVARQQVLLLRDTLDFVNSVRADIYASVDHKLDDLMRMQHVRLPEAAAERILAFDQTSWAIVQDEALSVLEQMMRGQVRNDQLEGVRRSVPARISVSLTEPQAEVVTALVTDLIAPNSFFNELATTAAREAARNNVEPVFVQLVRGQAVVVRGQVVGEEEIEALEALGLLETRASWRGPVGGLLATLLTGALLLLYIARFHAEFGRMPRRVLLLGLLLTVFLLAARLMVPDRTILPFMLPVPALAMLITVFTGPHLAIVVVLAISGLIGFIGGGSLELALYSAFGSIIAVLVIGRGERVNQFFWAGSAAAVANIGLLLAFRLPLPSLDPLGLAQLLAASVLNGAVSASLTLAGFFILGGLFDITTSLQLIELSRPDHPLLRFILRSAPGTYQHSLQVANLAEQAAERIGANAMLTRVGALYHDVGKALHPQFFVENQLEGQNVHDSLDPTDSARIIIGHIHDGLEMARRHRLPSAVRAFIPEHHGTLRTAYQYNKAVQEAGGDESLVDWTDFQYPGPRPQSKETALLMLADGCEAKARAERPKTEADIDRLVAWVINDRLAEGQLDDTGLTLRDLQLIRESFVSTLKGVFHPRLQYPEERRSLPAPAPEQTT